MEFGAAAHKANALPTALALCPEDVLLKQEALCTAILEASALLLEVQFAPDRTAS